MWQQPTYKRLKAGFSVMTHYKVKSSVCYWNEFNCAPFEASAVETNWISHSLKALKESWLQLEWGKLKSNKNSLTAFEVLWCEYCTSKRLSVFSWTLSLNIFFNPAEHLVSLTSESSSLIVLSIQHNIIIPVIIIVIVFPCSCFISSVLTQQSLS